MVPVQFHVDTRDVARIGRFSRGLGWLLRRGVSALSVWWISRAEGAADHHPGAAFARDVVMNEQDVINEQEWSRAENWSRWGYRSTRDTRLWVPKKNPRLGWTLNFARRGCFGARIERVS